MLAGEGLGFVGRSCQVSIDRSVMAIVLLETIGESSEREGKTSQENAVASFWRRKSSQCE